MNDWQHYLDVLIEELQSWAEAAVTSLPNLVLAVVIAAAFGVVAVIAGRLTGRLLDRWVSSPALQRLASTCVKWGVLLVGLFFALGVLGLQKTVTSLLAGAGIVGLALGFAFQDLAANFIAGILMAVRRPFQIGDIIETNDHHGTVHNLNLRNTIVETFEGQRVVIPNKEVFENPLVNYTTKGMRRVDIPVGVAYGTDLARAAEVAEQALGELDFVKRDEGIAVVAQGFGGSSIDLEARYWIDYPGDVGYPQALHRGVLAIEAAFADADIEIPFPIRTLQFDGRPTFELTRHAPGRNGRRQEQPAGSENER